MLLHTYTHVHTHMCQSLVMTLHGIPTIPFTFSYARITFLEWDEFLFLFHIFNVHKIKI